MTKVLEYCLEDISDVYPYNEGLVMSNKVKDKYKKGSTNEGHALFV